MTNIGGRIEIYRDDGHYQDRLRSYDLFVDGEPVGSLRRGQTFDVPVLAGTHLVEAKISSYRSELSIEVEDGETRRVRCWPAAPLWQVIAPFMIPTRWVGLETVEPMGALSPLPPTRRAPSG